MAAALKLPVMGNPKVGVMASNQAMAASSKAPMGNSLPTIHLKAMASRVSTAVAVAVEEVAVVDVSLFEFIFYPISFNTGCELAYKNWM